MLKIIKVHSCFVPRLPLNKLKNPYIFLPDSVALLFSSSMIKKISIVSESSVQLVTLKT